MHYSSNMATPGRSILFVASIFFCISVAYCALNTRIVGGSDAKIGEFPYQISLKKGLEFICGGSIISNEWILTAAHCLYNQNPKDYTVVVGSIYLYFGGTNYNIEKFLVHESFDKPTLRNDIALIKLKDKIQFHEEAEAVNLGTVETPTGTTVILSGWGMTSSPGIINPVRLKKLRLVTISLEECRAKIPYGAVDESNICAFVKNGEGACFGDSGGPLVTSETKQQIGVVSWGDPCAKGYPDIFTNVSYYQEWISNNMK